MRRHKGTDGLRRIDLFSECGERELRAILSLGSEVPLPAGAVMVREGTAGREAFVIKEGTARVMHHGEQIATLGPGDLFGEMALLDGALRSATVAADTSMTVLVLNSGEFHEMLKLAPSVARKVARGVAHRSGVVEGSAPPRLQPTGSISVA